MFKFEDISVEYIDHMGNDASVVNAARVSFGKRTTLDPNGTLSDRDVRLIKYLAKHKHTSPFGHAFASFRVKAPVFAARQLVKHKFLRWNETSRRYVDDDVSFLRTDKWRGRAEDKKQGSDGVVDYTEDQMWRQYCLNEYRTRLARGIAPEQARGCLPLDMMTEWVWSGSLDAFADMCKLRLPQDTQEESRHVAQQVHFLMAQLFPVSWEALLSTP